MISIETSSDVDENKKRIQEICYSAREITSEDKKKRLVKALCYTPLACLLVLAGCGNSEANENKLYRDWTCSIGDCVDGEIQRGPRGHVVSPCAKDTFYIKRNKEQYFCGKFEVQGGVLQAMTGNYYDLAGNIREWKDGSETHESKRKLNEMIDRLEREKRNRNRPPQIIYREQCYIKNETTPQSSWVRSDVYDFEGFCSNNGRPITCYYEYKSYGKRYYCTGPSREWESTDKQEVIDVACGCD